LAGALRWPFHSANALLFLPRVNAIDRLRGRSAAFAPCGAIAGLLSRCEFTDAAPDVPASAAFLRAPMRPQFVLDAVQRRLLLQQGVNGFDDLRPSLAAIQGARTLLPENAVRGEQGDVQARRLSLWLQACILEGTRWTRLSSGGAQQWQCVRAQAEAFLAGVAASGAFGADRDDERYFVICDERLNTPESVAQGSCRLLYGFAARGAAECQSWLVTHERSGSTVRAVTSNRMAIAGARVAAEIETAILRQVVSAA
jgi:hypothetical protein